MIHDGSGKIKMSFAAHVLFQLDPMTRLCCLQATWVGPINFQVLLAPNSVEMHRHTLIDT